MFRNQQARNNPEDRRAGQLSNGVTDQSGERDLSKRPEHFYRQSGVIPFRKRKGKLELLMVTSTNKKRWVIPKGVKEPHLSPKKSAIKEAWEEAGIRGKVSGGAIGAYRYRKWGGT